MVRLLRHRGRPYVPPSLPTLSVYPERKSWHGLNPGDRVVVREGEQAPYKAVVDVLTQDVTVIWVQPIGIGNRRAFHCGDAVEISAAPLSPREPTNAGGWTVGEWFGVGPGRDWPGA